MAKRAASSAKKPRPLSPTWVKAKVALHRSLSPHRSFRPTNKHEKPRPAAIPTTWQLVKQTFGLIAQAKIPFIGVMLLFLALTLLIIGAGTQQDYQDLKSTINQMFGGDVFSRAGTLLVTLLGGALTPQMSEGQQFTLFLLEFLAFLAVIWIARQAMSGNKPTIAQALFNSATPFTSALMMLGIVALQLLPLGIGLYVFSIANTGGFLSYPGFGLLVGFLAFLLALLSLYLVTTSIIGLVVVTLPGVYPLAALSSAKQLVIGRRKDVLLRILGLGFWIMVTWVIVLFPFLILDNTVNAGAVPYVPFALQILTGFTLLFAPVYIYRLYRSLL